MAEAIKCDRCGGFVRKKDAYNLDIVKYRDVNVVKSGGIPLEVDICGQCFLDYGEWWS